MSFVTELIERNRRTIVDLRNAIDKMKRGEMTTRGIKDGCRVDTTAESIELLSHSSDSLDKAIVALSGIETDA